MSTTGLNMSDTLTSAIRVQTESFYVPEHSDPANGLYFFAYRIRIKNEGTAAARLISRHWHITDGLGRVEEVKGSGVVGEQPYLSPGEEFEYTSFCPLPTDHGTMRGHYRMVRDDGTVFEAHIGPFKLFVQYTLN